MSPRSVPAEFVSLTAISPLDGRYSRHTEALREVFSEFALMRERVRVEVAWLTQLASAGLPELRPLAKPMADSLQQIVDGFSVADCAEIKAIEAETNHDVKAVEYFIRRRAGSRLGTASQFIHFACTSEDINNVAHALMIERGGE